MSLSWNSLGIFFLTFRECLCPVLGSVRMVLAVVGKGSISVIFSVCMAGVSGVSDYML